MKDTGLASGLMNSTQGQSSRNFTLRGDMSLPNIGWQPQKLKDDARRRYSDESDKGLSTPVLLKSR